MLKSFFSEIQFLKPKILFFNYCFLVALCTKFNMLYTTVVQTEAHHIWRLLLSVNMLQQSYAITHYSKCVH